MVLDMLKKAWLLPLSWLIAMSASASTAAPLKIANVIIPASFAKALEEGAAYTLTTGLESEKITMSSLVYSEGQSMQGPGQGGPRMDGQNGQP